MQVQVVMWDGLMRKFTSFTTSECSTSCLSMEGCQLLRKKCCSTYQSYIPIKVQSSIILYFYLAYDYFRAFFYISTSIGTQFSLLYIYMTTISSTLYYTSPSNSCRRMDHFNVTVYSTSNQQYTYKSHCVTYLTLCYISQT